MVSVYFNLGLKLYKLLISAACLNKAEIQVLPVSPSVCLSVNLVRATNSTGKKQPVCQFPLWDVKGQADGRTLCLHLVDIFQFPVIIIIIVSLRRYIELLYRLDAGCVRQSERRLCTKHQRCRASQRQGKGDVATRHTSRRHKPLPSQSVLTTFSIICSL